MKTILIFLFLFISVFAFSQNEGTVNDLDKINRVDSADYADIAGLVQSENHINVKAHGAVGDSTTDDAPVLSALFSSLSGNVTIYFPSGYYKVNSNLLIRDCGNIIIVGDNATIVNGNAATTQVLTVKNCKSLVTKNIDFNLGNTATVLYNLWIDSISTSVVIKNCNFYNFGEWDAYGIVARNITDFGVIGNADAKLEIRNCTFYNTDTITTSFNYDSHNHFGTAIMLMSNAEYSIITENYFDNLSCAVYSIGGANCSFTENIIRGMCDYDNGVQRTTSVLYFQDSGNNSGKWMIENNKFNHNYGRIIYSEYDYSNRRPININDNEFIANAYDPIIINPSNSVYGINIVNNFFDRAYDFGSLPNYPYTGNRAFIVLNNVLSADISFNEFWASPNYCVRTLGNSDKNKIIYNLYETVTTAFDSLSGSNDIWHENLDMSDINGSFYSKWIRLDIENPTSSIYIGDEAGVGASGTDNVVIGGRWAGDAGISANQNTVVGSSAFSNATAASGNSFFGTNTGANVNTGDDNTGFGNASLFTITTGSGNIALGHDAGFWENSSNKFYLDNERHSNLADSRANSLMYGDMALNTLDLNAKVSVDTLVMNGTITIKVKVTIADDGTYALPAANAKGDVFCITSAEYGNFFVLSDGTTTFTDGTIHNAEADGHVICLYDDGANAEIKNTSGGSLDYVITYIYKE